MTKVGEIYKCEICGNIVTVVDEAQGVLVCCNTDMVLLEEQTKEHEGKEKHVPVVEIDGNKVVVKVGSVEHPMEAGHYIELIQILRDNRLVAEARLNPNEKAEAVFFVENTEGIKARALCNVHGLWTN